MESNKDQISMQSSALQIEDNNLCGFSFILTQQQKNNGISQFKVQQTSDRLLIGPVVYDKLKISQLFSKQQIRQITNEIISKIRTKNQISIFMSDLVYASIPTILELKIQEFQSRAKNLQIEGQMKHFPCLKYLPQINFNNLTMLNLSKNQIDSIEALSFINSQSIIQIVLTDNLITNSKALVKTNFKLLGCIWLYLNPIFEMQQFYRMQNMMNMHTLDPWKQNSHLCEDYRFLPKLKNKTWVRIKDVRRVNTWRSPFFQKLKSQANMKIDLPFYE